MTEKEIEKARHSLVIKSNDLIQKSRFDLNAFQQKVMLYIISKINPWDSDFKTFEFVLSDFCQVCNIDYRSGGNYDLLKEAIKEIADKSFWLALGDGKETLVRLIEQPYIDAKSGCIKIRLNDYLKPYLLQVKQDFTKYELMWTIQFKSKYSIRLYELIKSMHYNDLVAYERLFSLDEIKARMGADDGAYSDWKNFRRRALEPAIEEISAYSDKRIEYEPITKGKKVIQIKLKISTKSVVEALNDKRL